MTNSTKTSWQLMVIILSAFCYKSKDYMAQASKSCQQGSGSGLESDCSPTGTICLQYRYKDDGICKDVLGNSTINRTLEEQTSLERNLKNSFPNLKLFGELILTKSIGQLKKFAILFRISINGEAETQVRKLKNNPHQLRICLDKARKTYCHAYFPACQGYNDSIRVLPLCRKACRKIRKDICGEVLTLLKLLKLTAFFDDIKCNAFPRGDTTNRNCFFPRYLLEGDGSQNVSSSKNQTETMTTPTTSLRRTPVAFTSSRTTVESSSDQKLSMTIKAAHIKSTIMLTRLPDLQNTTNPSPFQTRSPLRIVTPSTNSWYCKKYSYFFQNRSNSICKDVFGNDHLYYWRGWNYSEADNSLRRAFDALVPLVRRLLPSMQGQGVIATAKRFGNSYGPLFEKEFANITIPTLAQYDRCVKVVRPYACYETFETCDFSGRYPKAKYLCREACEFIQDGVCKEEVRLARIVDRIKRKSPEAFNFNPYVITIKYCYQYPRKKPGNADKCLIPDYFLASQMKRNTTETCYEDSGYRYRGNVNFTESGYGCQDWSSQLPHKHRFYTETFPELINAGNKCRNPRGFGDRPWCFTQNPNVTWDYCNIPHCPVDGIYSSWSKFSPCNETCGNGFQIRTRSCTDSQYGGRNCSSFGPSIEMKSCQLKPCPVDGGYSEWSDGKCNATCGNSSYKIQSRECVNPKPMHGGKDCTHLGPATRLVKCDVPSCRDVALPNGSSSIFAGNTNIILWSLLGLLGALTTFGLCVAFVRNRKSMRSMCGKAPKNEEEEEIEPYYIGDFSPQHIAKVMKQPAGEKISLTPPEVCLHSKEERTSNESKVICHLKEERTLNEPPPIPDSTDRPPLPSALVETVAIYPTDDKNSVGCV